MTWPRVSAGASRLAVARLPMKTAPTATPLTTVATRNRGIDAAESPATIKASAARNTVSPARITGRVGSRDPPSWMQAATAKARKTTAPATAWLVSCSTPTRNVGTSALNSPSRENAAKPANPAAMNSARPACGIPRPRNLSDSAERPLTVSGTTSRPSPATATSPSWTTKGSTVGSGAYWDSSPASSGPRARPPRLAADETSDARRPAPGRAVSVSAAVAVPVISPADRPESTRPTNSQPTFGARMNVTALTMLRQIAAASTGRRPTWSDERPASSSAVSTATAYEAKISVMRLVEKCHCPW
jgi:hypothetical protein